MSGIFPADFTDAHDERSGLREDLEAARRSGDFKKALELARAWRESTPGSRDASMALARALAESGAAAQAAAEYEALLAEYGPRVDALLRLGRVLEDMVRIEDAGRAYARALELEPENPDILCMAGISARDRGDSDAAAMHLARSLARAPGSAAVHVNLALVRLDQGRLAEAASLLARARAANRGEPWDGKLRRDGPSADPSDSDWGVASYKLAHDIEQLRYLRERGLIESGFDEVIAEYVRALGDRSLPADPSFMVALDAARYPLLARTYKKPLYTPDPRPPAGPLLNPELPWAEIEQRYFDSRPKLVYVDGLLSTPALAALRAWCLEATVWNDLKGGYLGAYLHDGFCARLPLAIARELGERMPRVIGPHRLQTLWGYKYDASYGGIGAHADVAAINVNFWITPDEANADPQSGGIVVYDHDAPRDWSFRRFNLDPGAIHRYLESVGSRALRVPYRENRAVIFDSDLFHETDVLRFREGYVNRRINVTMLYGTRAG